MDGPLATLIPVSSIEAVNKVVRVKMMENASGIEPHEGEGSDKKLRGNYQFFSPKEKAEFGKRAAELGITSTIRYFAKVDTKQRQLSPSTLFAWKENYLKELSKRRLDKDQGVDELPPKKRGRPPLLGTELDHRVQLYVKELRANGAIINTAIVMATGEGIVQHHDMNLLAKHGGPIAITKPWAQSLLTRMHFVKRRGNTKLKGDVLDFKQCKEQFVFDVKTIVEFEEIPDRLVINWDHTGINYVPVSTWTMEKEGCKRVEIIGLNDKRQITMVLAVTKNGHYLPPQLIYAGKTKKCLPKVNFPSSWHITCTENHWANEVTTLQYIDEILLPYIRQTRKELNLPPHHSSLVIFDRFKAQCTATVLEVLAENHILVALVPANCTDRLQPLDISINKPVKEFLRKQFHDWYANLVCNQVQTTDKVKPVDLRLTIMKPLGATWLIKLLDYLQLNPEFAINGFRSAGLL